MTDLLDSLDRFQQSLATSNPWLWWLGALVLALAVAFAVRFVVVAVVRRLARRLAPRLLDDGDIGRLRAPVGLILPLFAVSVVLPWMPASAETVATLQRAAALALIAAFGWLAVRIVQLIGDAILLRAQIDAADNLHARRVRTQIQVLGRIAVGVVVLITLAAMLMGIPSVRNVGLSLFASAGVVGLVAGMAARPALSNLIAGLQIAFTQPIRIDDVVIVEGEWGRIEEIGSTYVVVRIWDLRRLIVPLSYFIERPFQNWTHKTADLLGAVFLYVDYTVPVEAVRAELHRILQATELWDGKVWNLQVTASTTSALELRALMSAPDSAQAWELRCHVRERLVAWLQDRYPDSLPRQRSEVLKQPAGVSLEAAEAAAATSPDPAPSPDPAAD